MKKEEYKSKQFKILKIIGMVIVGLITAVVFGFLFGYFVQMLWNWLMPEIFGLKTITFWQAFGLIVLSKLIFGSFGHHKPHAHHHNRDKHRKWHKHHYSDEWDTKGGWKNWSYYEDWWKNQGKEAFEKYIEEEQKNEDRV